MKAKIGTEVAHITHGSDTTFKVKGHGQKGRAYCGGLPHSLLQAGLLQTGCIKFNQRAQVSILTLQDRIVAPIYVQFGMAERHVGSLGRPKFYPNRCMGLR